MLKDRYPGLIGQMRLDEDHRPDVGRAIDSWPKRTGVQHFYFRNVAGDTAEMVMDPQEIVAFRDGLNRILQHHGIEREVTIQVPR